MFTILQYDVTKFGGAGGGGEYEVQIGFGWTNGVVLDLLRQYGSAIRVREEGTTTQTPSSLWSQLLANYSIYVALAVLLFAVLAK